MEGFIDRLKALAEQHDILRMKGYASVRGKPMRLAVQGVGSRFRHQFDRPLGPDAPRTGNLVVIGCQGMDRAAIAATLAQG